MQLLLYKCLYIEIICSNYCSNCAKKRGKEESIDPLPSEFFVVNDSSRTSEIKYLVRFLSHTPF